MAGSVNKVILVGNVGKDPEIRSTQSGSKIGNINLATSKTWNDKQSGERKEQTEWHRVVSFNDHFTSVIERFVKKGSKIYVEGELRTRKWTDQSGQDRYTTEVVLDRFSGSIELLSSKKDDEQGEPSGSSNMSNNKPQQSQSSTSNNDWGDDLDDEIPF